MFEIKNNDLKISVRNLVEFLCRSGDIDNSLGGGSDRAAMEAGSRAHRKIQKSMGPGYRSEVPLKFCIPGEEYSVSVEGRADGIFTDEGITYIDEIKGTFRDIRFIEEAVYVHKAQAMCYGYFYGAVNGLDKVGIRITYVNLETENIRYFEEVLDIEYLKKWFDDLISELRKWGDFICVHRKQRNLSVEKLEFPFEYREGQRNLAVNVYKSILLEKNLFIQAPTGSGKTISTVFPAVKSMASGCTEKIFYLTAKTITRTAAEEAYALLRRKGLVFKSATITAKEKICLLESDTGPDCNAVSCPYAKGHYDRINEAVYDIITHEDGISRQTIEEYAIKHRVCPFELCLDVTYWTDGIICDYNYAFDPQASLKRYFSEGGKKDYVFLIDEAHNLVDRAREMYSASMVKEEILEIKRMLGKNTGKRLTGALEKCNRSLLELKRQCDSEYMILESEDSFALNMLGLQEELSCFIEKNRDYPNIKELWDFFFKVNSYNTIHENLDENYIIYAEHAPEGFTIRLFCVNPSGNLSRRIGNGRNGVFFSATLLPINYYKELLSGNREDYAIYADSVFDTSRRRLLIGKDVTSRYTRRNITEFGKIRDYIVKIARARTGNYLVFFPSYKYLEDVYGCREAEEDIEYIVQRSNMREKDKEDFLKAFENPGNGKSLVGLCVMGGIFSEGIDLKNDSLIGAIIVGTGLPSIDTRQQLLRKFFDDKENMGYEYAYIYPGMNKVLQAAGRVIRTEEDRGIIALLDDRFLTPGYTGLFPREWKDYRVVDVNNIEEEILDFWDNMVYNNV
ncbi:MAG: ATP-dependent DNA helicase [Butyrivibrio sp.]